MLISACLRLARWVGILSYEFSTAAAMIPMQGVQILLNMVKKTTQSEKVTVIGVITKKL